MTEEAGVATKTKNCGIYLISIATVVLFLIILWFLLTEGRPESSYTFSDITKGLSNQVATVKRNVGMLSYFGDDGIKNARDLYRKERHQVVRDFEESTYEPYTGKVKREQLMRWKFYDENGEELFELKGLDDQRIIEVTVGGRDFRYRREGRFSYHTEEGFNIIDDGEKGRFMTFAQMTKGMMNRVVTVERNVGTLCEMNQNNQEVGQRPLYEMENADVIAMIQEANYVIFRGRYSREREVQWFFRDRDGKTVFILSYFPDDAIMELYYEDTVDVLKSDSLLLPESYLHDKKAKRSQAKERGLN